jgi:hypothetical protein
MTDEEHVKSLEVQLDLIRDRVQGVVRHYYFGLMVHGGGGTSKSFTIAKKLEDLGASYKLTNSRISGKGFFELLRDHPKCTHVIEDAEGIFQDKGILGILRSSTWGPEVQTGYRERMVSWVVAGQPQQVIFEGGIILVMNKVPAQSAEWRAIATRFTVLEFKPTDEEIAAFARHIAKQGYTHESFFLSPEDCLDVVEQVVSRSKALNRGLDLRVMINVFADRLQWKNKEAETHWLDLLESRLQQRVKPSKAKESRDERMKREREIARGLAGLPPTERLAAWKEATNGKSEKTLYRHLEN